MVRNTTFYSTDESFFENGTTFCFDLYMLIIFNYEIGDRNKQTRKQLRSFRTNPIQTMNWYHFIGPQP